MTMTEPTVIDITDGEEREVSVAEYLGFWGGDPVYDKPPLKPGDGYVFYNYEMSGNNFDYLKLKLLPALKRQLLCGMTDHDKQQFETIKAFVEQKIADMEAGRPVPAVFKEGETFKNEMLVTITYDQVRQAMKGEPFKMRLRGVEFDAFAKAVNQGIDSHLQACFVEERGDRFTKGKSIIISVESLPVLLRRLYEADDETSNNLAAGIMQTLGFSDSGKWTDPGE